MTSEHPRDDGRLVWQGTLASPEDTAGLGQRIGAGLRAGDLVILTGPLGAGKTTLTQGIGRALQVRGQVASPTFIIVRSHRPLGDGPGLIHVDAYRLGSLDELDLLDLDTDLADCVIVAEWGEGLMERLSADRLEVRLDRHRGTPNSPAADAGPVPNNQELAVEVGLPENASPDAEARTAEVWAFGPRWLNWSGLEGLGL